MKNRLIGIDVARALAVIGMIIVNFKVVFGEKGESWFKIFAHLFEGKAAATFVVLAGLGLALMSNSAIQNQDKPKIKTAQKRIFKRAIFLFFVGLSYIWIWPADILHFYGIYMLIALLFIQQKPKIIFLGTIFFIFLFPVLLLFLDYENGWNFQTLAYTDFWTLNGFLRNLFFNGFHPVIPWTAFILMGLWLGKQNLYNDKFIQKTFWLSFVFFASIQSTSYLFIQNLSEGNPSAREELSIIFGTNPMPPLPLYLLNGISFAFMLITACIYIVKKNPQNIIFIALQKTGKLALTFYVLHVILGMGAIELLFTTTLGDYSINFSVVYALAFSLFCIGFALIWLKFRKIGPFEWLMRKVTD